ncbi:MAG: hypothetical protein R3F11_29345 [Verrucomicrobiales bacterium]
MDLTIPDGMGGAKAIEQIRDYDPEALAIVSSGYSDDPAMARPAEFGFSGVLAQALRTRGSDRFDRAAAGRSALGRAARAAAKATGGSRIGDPPRQACAVFSGNLRSSARAGVAVVGLVDFDGFRSIARADLR